MNKIFEALKNLLPADQVREVAKAVEDMLAEAREEIAAEYKAQYNAKLTEAYEQVSSEVAAVESTREEGYKQAYEIISDLRLRLESVREEVENERDQGYEQAYTLLKAEQEKNAQLEQTMYEHTQQQLRNAYEFFTDKIDKFLQLQNAEIYEQARRDVLSDPRMVEHKVALEKIIDVVGGYVDEDDFAGTNSAKLSEAMKSLSDLKGQMRVIEARNVRLSTQNTSLQEQVRSMQGVISEGTKNERKERAESARNASGRGSKVMSKDEILREEISPTKTPSGDFALGESMNQLEVLAGIPMDADE